MSAPITNAVALEAEHRCVAVCVLHPERIDLVTADSADFVDLRWRTAMDALRELRAEHGTDIDSLVLMDQVAAKVPHLAHHDLISLDASPHLIERYSEIVREEACKRRLRFGLRSVLAGLEGALAGQDGLRIAMSADEALTAASRVISEATIGQPDQALPISKIIKERFGQLAEDVDKISSGDETATGIPTGIDALDKYLKLQPGICHLIAARPAMGKSALALNLTNNISKAGVGVHVFSLEDTRRAYADRVLSMGSGVSATDIRSCQLNRGQLQNLAAAGDRISVRDNWLVDDRSGITAEEIVRCVRRNATENNTRVVIVDYMQLLRGHHDIKTRLSDAINCFGDAAKQDDMAYVCLSQLNRDCEKRPDKRPLLSDLKECGTLEERSKAVLMVYRPAVYGDRENGREVAESVMELILRKNSNGLIGTVVAEWRPERMQVR